MYKDLADATESLEDKGYTHTFELGDNCITCKKLSKEYKPDDLVIKETHSFDQGTDPGSEATVYAIEADDDVRGTLIISYGMYVDQDKASVIDRLLQDQE
ncbi:hypothetical protein [Gracilimonas mengyeensis]|uniref:Phosphoribosylpyrophosphate synthetase n=1 Tax=Gracilimonas mengyeensis TaxID=1302730 RepID=A0A521FLG4_9BACT|nr:hypothetical protein [Gracilimonas mengyeensis]SMO96979.1 hypothetical protein SAMN06265219_1228 [Gracilimonas mengyeensis]